MNKTENIIRDEFAYLEDDWESAGRYLSIFIDESLQTVDELTEALLALESGNSEGSLDQLFIAAHRIKGSAASIGLNRVAKLAHRMEDLLQVLVDNDRPVTPEIADGMLACTDGLREYVNALKTGRPEADHFDTLALQLPDAATVCDAAPVSSSPEPMLQTAPMAPEQITAKTTILPQQDAESTPADNNISAIIGADLQQRVASAICNEQHENVLVGQVVFEAGLALASLKARLVYDKLSNLGNVCYLDPSADEIDALDNIGALSFGVVTDRTPDVVRPLLQIAGVVQVAIEPLTARQSQAKATPQVRSSSAELIAKPAETLRVDIERLDRLMNLAGQLAIGKARVAQVADKLKTNVAEMGQCQLESLAQARASVNDLFETIRLLDTVSDGIRRCVMDMRMLPIGPLFTRFHRVIRDMTRTNEKEIHLTISGEKTELDKRMIDELGDPMIHLIRNAADHGIEAPDVREAAGKPLQGTISLDAFHRGSNIVIRVSDDGKGLDAQRIRAKAVEKGLVSAADAEQMTDQQIHQLIWLPGLSTADKVTDVSGRGMGMDIVRAKINELNGSVEVESELGKGTTFTIKLPLTLAILPSLMVEIDGDVFAVPLESVLEIVHVRQRDMTTVHGHWTVPIRDRVIAILALGSIFKWRRRNESANAAESDGTTLVIIGEENRQLGLAVDRVLGEEDVVIKSIADNYRNVAGIAGATILGDGRISLILDPATLIEMSSHPVAPMAAN